MKEDNYYYFPLTLLNSEKRSKQCAAMHAMAALFLLMYAVQFIASFQENWIYILAITPVSLYILFLSFFRKKYFAEIQFNRTFRVLELGFIFMGAMHFLQDKNWIGTILYASMVVILLSLLYIESRILQEQYIVFSEKNILIEMPLLDKKIAWNSVKDVILKNNFVTIAYTDGKFNQYEIKHIPQQEHSIEFHAFCKQFYA